MSDTITARITALYTKTLPELRKLWEELYAAPPPPYNKQFLIKRLAYRIQELAYGGLTKKIEQKLINYADETIRHPRRCKVVRPVIGTKLLRMYQGTEHQVTVLKDGFEYRGQHYKSLSIIARTIAGGTRWSGPVFFGLTHRNGGKKS